MKPSLRAYGSQQALFKDGAVPPSVPTELTDAKRLSPIPQTLLLLFVFVFGFRFSFACGYGLAFGSVNFRQEWLGGGWNCYFPQQQTTRCDLVSIHRAPGIIVLPERCTF